MPLQRKAGNSSRCGLAASPVKTKKGSSAEPRTLHSSHEEIRIVDLKEEMRLFHIFSVEPFEELIPIV